MRRADDTAVTCLLREGRQQPVLWLLVIAILSGCAGQGSKPMTGAHSKKVESGATASARAQEVVIYSLSLLDTGYRFGGKNPAAGIDCSGMVSYVYRNAAQFDLSGSAADMAKRGKAVTRSGVRAGDLVFFNTRGGPYTHVGIYVGDGRFIHAPSSSSGIVRIAAMEDTYFKTRFTEVRRYFD